MRTNQFIAHSERFFMIISWTALCLGFISAVPEASYSTEESPDSSPIIVDPALREIMRRSVGLYDGELSSADLETIKSIDTIRGPKRPVRTLLGIQDCVNLETISLCNPVDPFTGSPLFFSMRTDDPTNVPQAGKVESGSQDDRSALTGLEALPLLPNLTHLTICNRRLANATSLSECDNLIELKLNKIVMDVGVLDCRSMDNLVELRIGSSKMKQFPEIAGLVNLVTVTAEGNEIAHVPPVSGNVMLNYLDLSQNRIDSLDRFEFPEKLNYLDLSKNRISSADNFRFPSGLVEIDLSSNQISGGLSLENCSSLRKINLNRNRLKNLEGVSNLGELRRIDAMGNRIQQLQALKSNKALIWLDLSFNPLREEASAVLREMKSLKVVYMSDCNMKSLDWMIGTPELLRVRLWDNQIQDLGNIAYCKKLYEIHLDGNKIASIEPLRFLPNLSWVNLKGNLITDLSPLVANKNFGEGCRLQIAGNPLDPELRNEQIGLLRSRGVIVEEE